MCERKIIKTSVCRILCDTSKILFEYTFCYEYLNAFITSRRDNQKAAEDEQTKRKLNRRTKFLSELETTLEAKKYKKLVQINAAEEPKPRLYNDSPNDGFRFLKEFVFLINNNMFRIKVGENGFSW